MRTLSRALARWDMLRVAAAGLGVAFLFIFAALLWASVKTKPDLETVLAAISAAAIGGAGILYAWREPAA